jgi:hypothetical protein
VVLTGEQRALIAAWTRVRPVAGPVVDEVFAGLLAYTDEQVRRRAAAALVRSAAARPGWPVVGRGADNPSARLPTRRPETLMFF